MMGRTTRRPPAREHSVTCQWCRAQFLAARRDLAMYCTQKCKQEASGKSRIHRPEFRHYPRSCAACGATEQLVGDHCHDTGEPRGILCISCNLAAGFFDDNPERIRLAVAYLDRYR